LLLAVGEAVRAAGRARRVDRGCPAKAKRASKGFEELGWIVPNVYVFAVPAEPTSGVKVIVGVTAEAPRFCTTMVV